MSTTVSRDGTSIAFDRDGQGPTVVFVDGATAYRAINPVVARAAELLAPHLTVLAYDRRGRGESGDTPPYATEREIEDLGAVIGEADGPAVVVGFSSGAVLALDAAAHGLPISKLALYEPPFVVDGSRPPIPTDYVAHLDELVAAGRRSDAVEFFMTTAAALPAEFVGPMKESPFWSITEEVAHTISYDGRFMGDTMSGDPSTLQRWAGLTTRTLVVDGSESPQWLHNAADALGKVLPNARRDTLEGQSHIVAPDVLAPVIRDFTAE
jgi:pimeloyl-ACP methyl ester carboxylesterase